MPEASPSRPRKSRYCCIAKSRGLAKTSLSFRKGFLDSTVSTAFGMPSLSKSPFGGRLVTVVDVKVSETPPTVSVVLVEAEVAIGAVWRTHTVWPLVIVAAEAVKVPVQPTE